jgi:hypothetical protein
MTGLKAMLRSYPCWTVPHPGKPHRLTAAHRQENFEYIMAVKPARIDALRTALPELEPCIAALLDHETDPFAAVAELDEWWQDGPGAIDVIPPVTSALRRWLRPSSFALPNHAMAHAYWPDWTDNPMVPPMVSLHDDLALVIGEAMVLRRPDFAWTLNHDRGEKRRDTVEWGRTCVLRPAEGDWVLQAIDPLAQMRGAYGMLRYDIRLRMKTRNISVNSVRMGRFFGWSLINLIDGHMTLDHFPEGPDGPKIKGRRERAEDRP